MAISVKKREKKEKNYEIRSSFYTSNQVHGHAKQTLFIRRFLFAISGCYKRFTRPKVAKSTKKYLFWTFFHSGALRMLCMPHTSKHNFALGMTFDFGPFAVNLGASTGQQLGQK